MTYRLEFLDAAIKELIVIKHWIAEHSDEVVADRKVSAIETATFRLVERPHQGNLQPDLGENIRAVPIGEKAIVTFQVNDVDQTILVLSVTYGGQDWQSRARERL